MTFDMRNQIQLDLPQDKRQLEEAINSLRIPGFNATNVFDALYEGLDRLQRIDGRKYIMLTAAGRDPFSKPTLDQILKKVKAAQDIPILPVSTGGFMRAVSRRRGSIAMLQ